MASGCLTSLSTLFQLPQYRSSQFYWWRKPENLAITIGLPQITVKLVLRIYKKISKWVCVLVQLKLWRSFHSIKNEQQKKKPSQIQQGQISQRVKRCYMYDDTVGAWLAFQLLYVYCQLLGYVWNERFRKPECKVVWNRHSFSSDFKSARLEHYLNVGWCVISFLVFYIMFLLVNNKKNILRVVLKPQIWYIWQCIIANSWKQRTVACFQYFTYLINGFQAFTNLSGSPSRLICPKIIAMVFELSPLSPYN